MQQGPEPDKRKRGGYIMAIMLVIYQNAVFGDVKPFSLTIRGL